MYTSLVSHKAATLSLHFANPPASSTAPTSAQKGVKNKSTLSRDVAGKITRRPFCETVSGRKFAPKSPQHVDLSVGAAFLTTMCGVQVTPSDYVFNQNLLNFYPPCIFINRDLMVLYYLYSYQTYTHMVK